MKIYIIHEYDWDYTMDKCAYTNGDIAHEVCRLLNEKNRYNSWRDIKHAVKTLELI